MPVEQVLGLIGVGLVLVIGIGITVAKFYRQVDQGKALIVNSLRAEPLVTFTGAIVIPIINRAETMDISLKTIEIDRKGKEGLICNDNIRADIKVKFFVRVNKTREDVLKVAQAVGCVRASDEQTVQNLFEAKFSEALKTVGKRLDFEDLYKERDKFKDQIIQIIGKDLNGYMLEDAAIDYLEQTPVELLDKDNILDAQGIRKITELTAAQNILTNDFRQNERKAITKQNVEAQETILALERQQAEAIAKQHREVESIKAREEAETSRVQSEERSRSEGARIKSEEEIAINEQNMHRQVEVAQKNRERVVGIETERVQKDRSLEALSREREVELQRIAKEKALEIEKKQIADVIRARIAVDKTVAAEEEAIKDLRVNSEANRSKAVMVIRAEAEAQEQLVKEIKSAEASEEVAKHDARRKLTLADADLEAADKNAKAKIRMAEGQQAEDAAHGLALVKVKEADTIATEKQGMATVRVKEADAVAVEKQGLAQANVTREQLLAEAAGAEKKGFATVNVAREEADAVLKRGHADSENVRTMQLAQAVGIQEKLFAEARGLAEKATAMKALEANGRDHEEFRLRLQKDKEVELETIRVRQHVAEAQAKTMGEAFAHSKINIVGGDGAFFDRFVKAVTLGQTVDGAIDNSETFKTLMKGYLDGNKDLPQDLKDILSKPGITGDLQNLAIAQALSKFSGSSLPGAIAEKLKSAVIDAPKAK